MADSVTGVAGKDAYMKTGSLSSSSVITGRDASQLGMEDFFNLLVAQMTNQDMMNPTNDTEFIAQMAQFTTLQGIQSIQENQVAAYASSYVGKYVSIAHIGDSGSLTKMEGIVEKVSFYDGEPKVIVNNVSFPLYSVMEVRASAPPAPEEDNSGSGAEGSGETGTTTE